MNDWRFQYIRAVSRILCPAGALAFLLLYIVELFLLHWCPVWVRGPQASTIVLTDLLIKGWSSQDQETVLRAYDLASWMTDLKKTQAYAVFALWFAVFGQIIYDGRPAWQASHSERDDRLRQILARCRLTFRQQVIFGLCLALVMSGAVLGLLAGPFRTHVESLDWVDRAKEEAYRMDPRSVFYAFGTTAMRPEYRKPGKLNDLLGLKDE